MYRLKIEVLQNNSGNGHQSLLAHFVKDMSFVMTKLKLGDHCASIYSGGTHYVSIVGKSKDDVVMKYVLCALYLNNHCVELYKMLGSYLKGSDDNVMFSTVKSYTDIGLDGYNLTSRVSDNNPKPRTKRVNLSSKKINVVDYPNVGSFIATGLRVTDKHVWLHDKHLSNAGLVVSVDDELKVVYVKLKDIEGIASVNCRVNDVFRSVDVEEYLEAFAEIDNVDIDDLTYSTPLMNIIGAEIESSTCMHEGLIEGGTIVGTFLLNK